MNRLYYVECLDNDGDEYATTIFGNSPEGAIERIKSLWEEHEVDGHTAVSARVYDEDKCEEIC